MRDLWKFLASATEVLADDVEPFVVEFGKLVDKLMHQSVRVLETYCCLDLKRYTKGDKHGSPPPLQGSLPVLFVLFLLMLLYNAFVFAYMPAAGIAFNSPTSLMFHAFIFLVLSSFVQAVRTDPGSIPQTKEWRTPGCPPEVLREKKKGSDEARWCRKSDAYKPDRAHYCRTLKKAILRMDHHCPWLGNTVGFANHKYFFLFLMYANAAAGVLGISVLELLVKATLPPLTTFLLLGAEGLTTTLSMILGPFFIFHIWLLARNMTTIEFCERMRNNEDVSGDSRYDKGLYANISSVLGWNPALWFLPCGGPMGDGLSFPLRGGTPPPSEPDLEEGPASASYVHADTEADPEAAHPVQSGAGDDADEPVFTQRNRVQIKRYGSAANAGSVASSSHVVDIFPPSKAEDPGAEGAEYEEQEFIGSQGGSEEEGGSLSDDYNSLSDYPVASAADDANCFLAWMDAEEFREDLEIGCEYIGETFEVALLRILGLCAGPRRRRVLESAARAQWRRRAIRIVPIKKSRNYQDPDDDNEDFETNSTGTMSNGGGSISGTDFFSD